MYVRNEARKQGREGGKTEGRKERMEGEGGKEVRRLGGKQNKDCWSEGRGSKA